MRALLVAFLGVAFVAAGPGNYPSLPYVDTRDNCPPEGYTALSPYYKLDRLPSGGKYAICQTAAQGAAAPGTDHLWTLTSGVFRLRNSELIVDADLQIVFQYPAYPDWTDVAVKGFPGDTDGSNVWNGISIRGAPSDELLEAAHHPHWPTPFGNCGDFDTVVVDDVNPTGTCLFFDHCSSKTTIKKVTTFSGQVGVIFTDSKKIVVKDSFFAGENPPIMGGGGGTPTTGTPTTGMGRRRRFASNTYVGVRVLDSQMAFINLIIYGDNGVLTSIEIDGSYVTICNLFTKVATGIQIGSDEFPDSDPSSLAIAGLTNEYIGKDTLGFFGPGGVVFTLRTCPAVISTTYDMSEWVDFFTSGVPVMGGLVPVVVVPPQGG